MWYILLYILLNIIEYKLNIACITNKNIYFEKDDPMNINVNFISI